jgi:hypothetical protein
MRINKRKASPIIAATAGLRAISIVRASDVTWVGNGADANWSTGANWSTVAAPISGENLAFDNGNNTNTGNDLIGLILRDHQRQPVRRLHRIRRRARFDSTMGSLIVVSAGILTGRRRRN